MGRIAIAAATVLTLAFAGCAPPWLSSPRGQMPIRIDEGAAPPWFFAGDPLEGLRGRQYRSFHVVADDSLRRRIEVALMRTLRGWPLGPDPARVIFEIRWADGSQSVFRPVPTAPGVARYVDGRSYDATGNVLPDAEFQRKTDYLGTRTFASRQEMTDWATLAEKAGIHVGGTPSARNEMICIIAMQTKQPYCSY